MIDMVDEYARWAQEVTRKRGGPELPPPPPRPPKLKAVTLDHEDKNASTTTIRQIRESWQRRVDALWGRVGKRG